MMRSCNNVVILTSGQNCPMLLLSPGSVQTVDTFQLTAVFFLVSIATKLTNTTQKPASDYKLLRTLKLLSLYETNTNILKNLDQKCKILILSNITKPGTVESLAGIASLF